MGEIGGATPMKFVVVGGTGRVGSKVVPALAEHGHEVVVAARSTGVDAHTGQGVAEALAGADVVIDVTRPTTYVDTEVFDFFMTSTANLLTAEREAGVGHHVVLSVVGCDLVPDSGFLHAKSAQEQLVARSGQRHTVVRATQFFEFVAHIADALTVDGVVRVPAARIQPIAVADAATAVVRAAEAAPIDGIVEVGGPEQFPMEHAVRRMLAALGDTRPIVADPEARYFGTRLTGCELTPRPGARLSATTFEQWLAAR